MIKHSCLYHSFSYISNKHSQLLRLLKKTKKKTFPSFWCTLSCWFEVGIICIIWMSPVHFQASVICYLDCPLESSRKIRVMVTEISNVSTLKEVNRIKCPSIDCWNTYRGHQQPAPQLFPASACSYQPQPTLRFLVALQTQSGPPPLPQTARWTQTLQR